MNKEEIVAKLCVSTIALEEENTNLKQALIDIREFLNSDFFKLQFENSGNEYNVKNNILKIIDEVLFDKEVN